MRSVVDPHSDLLKNALVKPKNKSIIDLIFNNCYIIDRSNDWSLLLFKEAYHIRRSDQPLNHCARASTP